MSYLNPPRLHFAGRFRTDVSTVNNVVEHFENPSVPPGQGWNPKGGASWELMDCTVTTAVYADGTVARASSDDSVVGLSLAQVGTARLVDLDPEQQMVSQIWGLRLQLRKAGEGPAFSGAFKTTAFSDIWFNRARVPGGGDFKASAFYQSVLTGVAWNNLLGSRLLTELEQASGSGLLSIKFNLDGFDQTTHIGRVVGTIGPALEDEPAHFVVGRQCMGSFAGPVWFFPALVDTERGKLVADFGNALQTTEVGGPFDSTLDLELGLLTGNGQFSSLWTVPIGPAGWYEDTAGICEFPSGAALNDAELTELATMPIGVRQNGGASVIVASEGIDGLHVRAEDFVYRMSANDTASVSLRASRFGLALPNAEIAVAFDLSGLQQGSGDPEVGDPPGGLSFPATVTTDAQGRASLQLTANSIDTPRGYIDGQVYGVRYTLAGSDQAGGYFDPADFVSVLLWTDYAIPDEPTWTRDVQPILGEYAGLYPVMKQFVDLSSYDSVVANKAGVEGVFSLPQENPGYMPVTRDLSPAKRQMILNWLLTTGNAGEPNFDTGPATPEPPPMLVAAAPAGVQDDVAALGGKTAAFQRRRGPST